MAKIYYRKIISGDINPDTGVEWVIDDVPTRWRDEVQEMLDDDRNENIS